MPLTIAQPQSLSALSNSSWRVTNFHQTSPTSPPPFNADQMRLLDALTHGKVLQQLTGTGYKTLNRSEAMRAVLEGALWRMAVFDSVMVNGSNVPAPMLVSPAIGATVYLADCAGNDGGTRIVWDSSPE